MANKICLRCGYCCQTSLVSIVVDPDIGPCVRSNIKAINCLEERCPHLQGDKAGDFKCAVHDRSWYPGTPCGQYNNYVSGLKDVPCPMGEYVLGRTGYLVSVTCPGCKTQKLVRPEDRESVFPCPECGYTCEKKGK